MSYRASITAHFCIVSVLILLLGCATFRSDIDGRFEAPGTKHAGADKVSVLFVLRHIKQAIGLDAIPKLQSEKQIVRDFDNIFLDALGELSNVSNYATFTEFPSDVSKPERRARRDSMISQYDFVLRTTITKEHSFIKHFLGGGSLLAFPDDPCGALFTFLLH